MIEIDGLRVYETLPANCVDLDNTVVITLDLIIDDLETGISSYALDDITSAGTVDGIAWGRDGEAVIVDVPKITEGTLRSLQAAGLLN